MGAEHDLYIAKEGPAHSVCRAFVCASDVVSGLRAHHALRHTALLGGGQHALGVGAVFGALGQAMHFGDGEAAALESGRARAVLQLAQERAVHALLPDGQTVADAILFEAHLARQPFALFFSAASGRISRRTEPVGSGMQIMDGASVSVQRGCPGTGPLRSASRPGTSTG